MSYLSVASGIFGSGHCYEKNVRNIKVKNIEKSQLGPKKNVCYTKCSLYQMYAKSRLKIQRQRVIQSVHKENVR